MGFLSDIGRFLGGLVGLNDDEEKKKKQQQSAPQRQAAPNPRTPTPGQIIQPNQQPAPEKPENGLNLVLPGDVPLKKAQPKVDKNAQAAAEIGSQLGYGPNASASPTALVKANPTPRKPIEVPRVNMPLEIAKQAGLGIAHDIIDPAIHSYENMQKANAEITAKNRPGLTGAAQDTLEQTGNFIKAIGQTGAEYAGYAAPEIKGLKVAADAPKLIKAGSALVRHGATSAPLTVGADLAAGERDPLKIATDAGVATLASGALGGMTGLRKAGAPSEVAPGVHSINPTREADAVAAAQAKAAQDAERLRVAQEAELDTPAYQRKTEAALDVPTFQRNNADELVQTAQAQVDNLNGLRKVQPYTQDVRMADQAELAAAMARSPEQAAMVLRKQLLRKTAGSYGDPNLVDEALAPVRARAAANLDDARVIQMARDEVAGLPQPASTPAVFDELPTPAQNTAQMVATGEPMPVSTPTGDLEKVVESSSPGSVSQMSNNVNRDAAAPAGTPPVMPEPAVSNPVAPAAPLTHDALVKQLGPVASDLKGKYSERTAINLDELKQRAEAVVANMSDEDLLKSFSTTGPDTIVNDANSFAVARAALDRLAQMGDDPHAAQVVSNILDGLDRYVSKSGEGLRIAQEAFDSMPLPMKVRYIVKKIDAAWAGTDHPLLRDDPAKAAIVEANITGHLQASQVIAEKAAAIEGQLNQIAEAVKNGEPTPADPRPLAKQLKDVQRELAANNGELVKYYSDLVPGRSAGQKALNDFPRRMMLASFTGRVNDIITTSANVANLGVQNLIQGAMAKVVNAIKPGTITDTTRGGSKIFTGGATELKKTVGEVRGTQYVDDVAGALKGNVDARSGLQKAQGVVGRTVQAATEMATNLSAGVRDQRLYQLAAQEAEQAGLRGQALADYAEARAAVPSPAMLDRAEMLHKQVNNLNENPISRTLNRVAAAIEGKSAFGGLIKNQVMPFTSWLGGNFWNSLTDKNVVASFVKLADSARKGDAEGIAQNLAKLGNNAIQMYALGYLLSQAGLITNEDAEGYNDYGAYFHIGDRYIPVGFFGFVAPNIVLGNAAYQGMNTDGEGGPAEGIGTFAEAALYNMAKAVGLANVMGVENNLQRSYEAATRPGGTAGDFGATLAAGAVGQFIPALAGDANAILNNYTDLNPTKEAADTKVVNPNSPSGEAKDVPASALKGLANRIPFLSQTLPRKADVAADDLIDRTTKGDRETPGGAEVKAKEKTAADQVKDFKKRGIPDPAGKNFDDAVKARVEAGEYDKAIEGLNAKIKANQSNKDVPQSKTKELQDEVKKLEVTRDGKYDPKVIELYKKTSLTEWRNMGDPESDDYDPDTYKLLYNYDKDLAGAGVSRNTTKGEKPFYYAKTARSGGRGRSGGGGNSTVKSNTIGNTPALAKLSLGDLSPQKAGSVKMPTIQQIKAGDLVKKRQISVKKA